MPNPHYQPQAAQASAPPPPPSGGQPVANPHYAAAQDTTSLGTRLTIQALRDSPSSGVMLNVPNNYPVSPDLEDRTSTPNNTTLPLADQVKSGLNTFVEKTKLAYHAVRGDKPQSDE